MSRIKTALPIAAATAVSLFSAAPALAADRDHDGMSDRWEQRYHVTKARFDADRDGLSNLGEFRLKTDPRKADTDHDGITDGAEKRLGTDATTPRKGGDDGVAAVASFAAEIVTFSLEDGRTVTATVTEDTRVECRVEHARSPVAVAARHGGRDEEPQVDDSGPGNAQDREQQAAEAPAAADEPEVDNSGPGNAEDRCTPEEIAGASVRKAELRLGEHGVVLTRLELVAIR